MRVIRRLTAPGLVVTALVVVCVVPAFAQTGAPAEVATATRDIPFTTHDGHAMVGRLTLPQTGGPHPVLLLVQTAEASRMDPRTRTGKGEMVFAFDLYRRHLAPIGVGFFSYEGRGMRTDPSQPRGEAIDWAVYNTSTLDNKVRDIISAVRVLQQQPGVDKSKILLRGVSEGTQLAADAASRIPKEIGGLVLSGVVSSTLKDMLTFMALEGTFMQHREHWDDDRDGRITPAEFETDSKGVRRKSMPGVAFSVLDPDKDGAYTVADRSLLAKDLVAGIQAGNMTIVNGFLKLAAAVTIPQGWAEDHFAYPPMWQFLSKLDMPVGFFHGDADANTPIAGVKSLEQQAKAAGKTNFEFQYFTGLGHGLGTNVYFETGTPSTGYAAIFDFVRRVVARR
jgi:pimeloyl-ACP methyl ester carboxylesterase